MAGNRSKIKGVNGERELAKILSSTFEAPFIRSDGSGAYIGGKNIGRKDMMSATQTRVRKADIIPPDHLPRLVIECKARKDFGFHSLIQSGPCPLLDDWIKQTIDVIDPEDQWFVAFKIRLRGWYLVVPESESTHYVFGNYCDYTGIHGRFHITDLIKFFQNNRDNVVKTAGPITT
jgi:Holliday junction resolvase